MSTQTQDGSLPLILRVVGALFVVGLYPLTLLWPAGFMWEPRQPEYEMMIIGMYAVLGIFLWIAAKDPSRHLSLISFTAWSSLVHGGSMLIMALRDPAERSHLYGDVLALFVIGGVLLVIPRNERFAAKPG